MLLARPFRNAFLFAFLASVAPSGVVLGPSRSMADPPFEVPFATAVKQADFVGVVKIAGVPQAPKAGFRASAPPTVTAIPVSAFKGDAKAELRIVWQTYFMCCLIRDRDTIEITLPAVGEEYMVFLTQHEGGTFARLGYQWHFHKMPAVPAARVQPSWDTAWRGQMEVTPAVAGMGEAVRYRFTRTRLAEAAWTGEESAMTAGALQVVDVNRKEILAWKKPQVRKGLPTVVEKGETIVDAIDLTEAFGISKPGVYWVFGGGAADGNAPLRFEDSDKLRVRTGKD